MTTISKKYEKITFVTYILDKSSSMYTMDDTPEKQLREFLDGQKEVSQENNVTIFITVITFDQKAIVRIDNQNISNLLMPSSSEIKNWVQAEGFTRFFNTVEEAIQKQNKDLNIFIRNLPLCLRSRGKPPKIEKLLYVLTDGKDNRSTTQNDNVIGHTGNNEIQKSQQSLKKLLLKERKKNLVTIFLAANIGDAMERAEEFGFEPKLALTIGSDKKHSSIGMKHANNMAREISSNMENNSENISSSREFSLLQRESSVPVSSQSLDEELEVFQITAPLFGLPLKK